MSRPLSAIADDIGRVEKVLDAAHALLDELAAELRDYPALTLIKDKDAK